jgi:hypothetical protein
LVVVLLSPAVLSHHSSVSIFMMLSLAYVDCLSSIRHDVR